uniref:Uncharacterized protein n=1 Tax=Manihot esculenta TaxID=3983 RepID=A0A199UC99_MANES
MEEVPLPFPHRAKQECSSRCKAYARDAESPSQLTWACNPSGGYEVVGRCSNPDGWIRNGYLLARPFQAGKYRVRLASQSSDHLPLPAVEG